MCVGGTPPSSTTPPVRSDDPYSEMVPAERGLDIWYHATYWPTIKALLDFAVLARGYDESFVVEANYELRNDEH